VYGVVLQRNITSRTAVLWQFFVVFKKKEFFWFVLGVFEVIFFEKFQANVRLMNSPSDSRMSRTSDPTITPDPSVGIPVTPGSPVARSRPLDQGTPILSNLGRDNPLRGSPSAQSARSGRSNRSRKAQRSSPGRGPGPRRGPKPPPPEMTLKVLPRKITGLADWIVNELGATFPISLSRTKTMDQ